MDLSSTPSFLDPASAARDTLSKQKTETIRIAKEQEKAIHEKLARNNHPIPKYEFLELIGKGAYGRVFKCLDQTENRIVALKVIDVDSHDYKVNAREKDDSIEVTMHEIKVLKQLKDANTKNVNIIFDAFQIHSQLWIVNEYCPGGSVRTLMRSTGDRLENKFIVPIARELAIALKAIHDGGIIHRDIKAANVMVHEDGRLQVIDFGVAGVLQTTFDKRSTVIGTPHWMAPELHKLAPREGLTYGTEVDVWAYGCTLYEIATGLPPYPKTQPGRMLGVTLGRAPPRLNKLDHAKELCDLVAYVLEAKPIERPSMEAVLQHPYILNSEDTHPTKSLAELVKIYYRWERSGGQRQSLFINAGAAAAEFPPTLPEEDEWNFSTTATFEQEIYHDSDSFDPFTPSHTTPLINHDSTMERSSKDDSTNLPSIVIPDRSPPYQSEVGAPQSSDHTPTGNRTPVEKLNTEERVKRGANALKGLFDELQAPYKYQVKADFVEQKPVAPVGPSTPAKSPARRSSDLPLRDESVQSSVYHKEFDADQVRSAAYDNLPNIDLANVGTIKANRMNRFLDNMGQEDKEHDSYYYGSHPEDDKRATKDWTFPTTEPRSAAQDPKRATIEWGFPPEMPAIIENQHPAPVRPNLKHAKTAPVGEIEHSAAEMIDLDALYDDPLYDSNVLSTAPGSGDDAPSSINVRGKARMEEASDVEDETLQETGAKNFLSNDSGLSEDELNVPHTAKSEASSLWSSDSENEYDPFAFDNDALEEEAREDIEAVLDGEGVTDPLEREQKRRTYLKAVRGILNDLDADLEGAGYQKYKKRHLLTAVGDFPEKDHALWAMYDPEINPAPPESYPMGPSVPPAEPDDIGPSARLGDPDFPLAQGLKTRFTNKTGSSSKSAKNAPQYPSVAALEAAARNFPEMLPPSAEAMSANAPPGVLEAELKRLLGDWNRGMDVLGDLLADVGDTYGGIGGSSDGGSSAAGGQSSSAAQGHGRGRGNARGRGHGRGRGRGRGRAPAPGTGNVMPAGTAGTGGPSIGSDEDPDPSTSSTSNPAAGATPNPDAAQQHPPAPAAEE